MRIHSDILTASDMHDTIKGLAGVYVDHLSDHGSRKRANGVELRLVGNSPHLNMAKTDNAATWDEWGVVMVRIFGLDPNALIGGEDEGAFHERTNYRFDPEGLPEDTHARHNWGERGKCTKCSAKYGSR